MTLYNNGTISIETKYVGELIKELNKSIASKCILCVWGEDDYVTKDDKSRAIVEIGLYGDIETDLDNLSDAMKKIGAHMVVDINFDGDYTGSYRTNRTGDVELLSESDLAVKEASDDELIRELKARGYIVMAKPIYTYRFHYEAENDDFTEIEFCASTKREAKSIFYTFCEENKIAPKNVSCEIVFNEDDAEEYGSRYGVAR